MKDFFCFTIIVTQSGLFLMLLNQHGKLMLQPAAPMFLIGYALAWLIGGRQ